MIKRIGKSIDKFSRGIIPIINLFKFLCVLCVLCGSISAQDFKKIQDGIEYAEITREIDKQPVKMNLLRLDLSKVRLDVVHAMDAAIGTETVSSMATQHGAIAAINAGFFRLDKSIFAGEDVGVLMIDRKLLSESYENRIALLINNDKSRTEVRFENLDVSFNLLVPKHIWKISGINRERKNDELILYTPEFHLTTLTDNSGLEISVNNGRIIKISDGKGSSQISTTGFVLSVKGKLREELIKYLKIGDKVSIVFPTSYYPHKEPLNQSNSKLLYAEDVVGGVPQLIKNGKIEITWEEEKAGKSFYETKHPRTAVAKLKDGKFLMVTVDGRSESSGGIGLENLAKLLLEFGATDAMNLDGGGSTTMFLDGKVVNHPSDKEGERKVGDAILVFPRKKIR